jgi:hypothetical protein
VCLQCGVNFLVFFELVLWLGHAADPYQSATAAAREHNAKLSGDNNIYSGAVDGYHVWQSLVLGFHRLVLEIPDC